jgi:hypothetical protein
MDFPKSARLATKSTGQITSSSGRVGNECGLIRRGYDWSVNHMGQTLSEVRPRALSWRSRLNVPGKVCSRGSASVGCAIISSARVALTGSESQVEIDGE